jgi:hypothetical protein
VITYAPLSSDFSLYFHPDVPRFVTTVSYSDRVDAFSQLENVPVYIFWLTTSNRKKISPNVSLLI